MLKLNKYIHRCKFIGLVLLIIFGLSSCTSVPKSPAHLPMQVNFSLDKGDEVVELDLKIFDRRPYRFGITFLHHEKIKAFEDYLRIIGESENHFGVPLKFRLKIMSKTEGAALFNFEDVVSDVRFYSSDAEGFYKKIDDVWLEPGSYTVRLTNLIAAPETKDIPIKFHIRTKPGGK